VGQKKGLRGDSVKIHGLDIEVSGRVIQGFNDQVIPGVKGFIDINLHLLKKRAS
jgi:hypothetical protein